MSWFKCNLCGYPYRETELIIDKETKQPICTNCVVSKEELDREQEDIERQMRAEKKMKAGIY